MRFEAPNCPDCSKPATSMIETVEVRSYLEQAEDQFFIDTTLTDVIWETQTPLLDGEGKAAQAYLGCGACGKGWWSPASELEVTAIDEGAATLHTPSP